MKFFKRNFIDTITVLNFNFYAGTTNTQTSLSALFDNDKANYWKSDGYSLSSIVTTASLTITFNTETTISKMIILNHNLNSSAQGIRFKCASNTGGLITINQTTGTYALTGTSAYIEFNTQTAKVFNLELLKDTATSSPEFQIGELVFTDELLDFERNPPSKDYKPTIYRKQVRHEMPDGGVALYNIEDKFRAKFGWDFITESFKNSLQNIYDTQTTFYFVPFPTITSWDSAAYPVAWTGPFDAKPSDNNIQAGYSLDVTLEQLA